jgi:hypothetical protein
MHPKPKMKKFTIVKLLTAICMEVSFCFNRGKNDGEKFFLLKEIKLKLKILGVQSTKQWNV